MEDFRAAFRRERKQRIGGADKLAAKSGVNRSTIYAIETEPDYIPGVDTVATLIEAMPGLTLSSFFAEIERRTDPVTVKKGTQPLHSVATVKDDHALPQSEVVNESRRVSAETARIMQELAAALIDASSEAARAVDATTRQRTARGRGRR